jgi:hypothetical protein
MQADPVSFWQRRKRVSDEVLTRIIVFAFVAVVVVAVFTWFSVSHWINARTAERKNRERNALLRHLAEQPAESARLVLEMMREDEEQARKDAAAQFEFWIQAQRSTAPGARAGLVIVACGVGLSIFLYSVAPDKGAWALGVIPALVGSVIAAFDIFGKGDDRGKDDRGGSTAE